MTKLGTDLFSKLKKEHVQKSCSWIKFRLYPVRLTKKTKGSLLLWVVQFQTLKNAKLVVKETLGFRIAAQEEMINGDETKNRGEILVSITEWKGNWFCDHVHLLSSVSNRDPVVHLDISGPGCPMWKGLAKLAAAMSQFLRRSGGDRFLRRGADIASPAEKGIALLPRSDTGNDDPDRLSENEVQGNVLEKEKTTDRDLPIIDVNNQGNWIFRMCEY